MNVYIYIYFCCGQCEYYFNVEMSKFKSKQQETLILILQFIYCYLFQFLFFWVKISTLYMQVSSFHEQEYILKSLNFVMYYLHVISLFF